MNEINELLICAWSSFQKNSGDFFFIKNANLKYVLASDLFLKMLGYNDVQEIVGKTDFNIFNDYDLAKRYNEDDLRLFSEKKPIVDYIEPIPSLNDLPRYASTSKYLIYDKSGVAIGMYGIGRDVTEQMHLRREAERLTMLAERDAMTGLYNHSTALKKAEEYLTGSGKAGTHALFMIDVDNFKNVNDTFGHRYGDSIIMKIAGSIGNIFRASDIVGRIGGDEFIVLMKNIRSKEYAQQRARAVLEALTFTCSDARGSVKLSASVGITLYEGNRISLSALQNKSDIAMYEAKNAGKGRYVFL